MNQAEKVKYKEKAVAMIEEMEKDESVRKKVNAEMKEVAAFIKKM